jgi:hypothetical protein
MISERYVSQNAADPNLAFAIPMAEILAHAGDGGKAVGLFYPKADKPRNPFFFSGAIYLPEQFIDRTETLEEITRRLERGQSVAVVSGSLTGKSSLLRQIHQHFHHLDPWQTVLIDMNRITSQTHFFEQLALDLLKKKLSAAALDAHLATTQLLLCIDDFHLIRHLPRLALYLRGLAQWLGPGIPPKVVLATSLRPTRQVFPDEDYARGSRPDTYLEEINLPPFVLEDAQQLALTYLNGTGIQFSRQDIITCHRQAEGSPYRLQKAFSKLFDSKIR